MKAWISIQAGVALLENLQGVQVLSVDGAPLAPTVRAAQHLLMSATDLSVSPATVVCKCC